MDGHDENYHSCNTERDSYQLLLTFLIAQVRCGVQLLVASSCGMSSATRQSTCGSRQLELVGNELSTFQHDGRAGNLHTHGHGTLAGMVASLKRTACSTVALSFPLLKHHMIEQIDLRKA
jgi:hypothetical protein